MAAVTFGSVNSDRIRRLDGIRDKSYDYDYPEGLDLRPGEPFHDKLATEILRRADEAHNAISRRFSTWRQIDRTLTTYIDLTESEESLQDSDPNKPVSIVFPNSYAILETMLSYMTMAFLQDPIFRYIGFSPEDTVGAMLMEKVIQQHCEYNKVALNFHTMFRDNFAYGLGVVVPTWKVTTGKKPQIVERFGRDWLSRRKKLGEEIQYVEGVIHEGNALMNVDPYLFLPDPTVSITELQSGEFVGWINNTNLMDLLSQELTDADLFNVKYLKHIQYAETSIVTAENSDRNLKTKGLDRKSSGTAYQNKVDVITLYVKLIPSEWKLADRDDPEVWVFDLAGDSIIIRCRESGLAHGKFPVAVAASEYDGYSSAPISRLEILNGLQGVLDWLFNSHIANVRKSLNDMFVVDPYLININDLKDPRPGKLIRMRRPAWGRGVQHAVQQLAVNDVTRGNMADSGLITTLMQTLAGTDNPMMGNLRSGGPERLTSTEFQGTMRGAVGRLERVARITSYQVFQEVAHMFATNCQQLMTHDTYVQTVGAWPTVIQENFGVQNEPVPVSPFNLIVDYDLRMRDGSIPGGNFSQAWIQLYQIMASNPELMNKFDMVRVFKHIAVNLGAKNVNEFERAPVMPTVSTAPDAQVAAQAQQGNLAPVEEVF